MRLSCGETSWSGSLRYHLAPFGCLSVLRLKAALHRLEAAVQTSEQKDFVGDMHQIKASSAHHQVLHSHRGSKQTERMPVISFSSLVFLPESKHSIFLDGSQSSNSSLSASLVPPTVCIRFVSDTCLFSRYIRLLFIRVRVYVVLAYCCGTRLE